MTRVISGVLLAAGFFALVWFSNASVLLAAALVVGVLAFHEYAELMRALGAAVPRVAGLFAVLATIVVVPFPLVSVEAVLGSGLVIVAAAGMIRAGRERLDAAPESAGPAGERFKPAVAGIAAGGLALVYLGVPLGSLVGIHIYGGRGAVLLLVATIAISDTAQYYSGRLLGRHLLAPRISPKKTIEGAIGGFVVAPLFLYFAGPYFVPIATATITGLMGVVLVACGIAGDLFESTIKRAADSKDSSALIPGHGGVLDRIDALLFAALPFYMFLRWIYLP